MTVGARECPFSATVCTAIIIHNMRKRVVLTVHHEGMTFIYKLTHQCKGSFHACIVYYIP